MSSTEEIKNNIYRNKKFSLNKDPNLIHLIVELDIDEESEYEGITIKCVDSVISGVSRWSIHYRKVFLIENSSHYIVTFSSGATEYQEERPFEYDNKVVFVPAIAVNKISFVEASNE